MPSPRYPDRAAMTTVKAAVGTVAVDEVVIPTPTFAGPHASTQRVGNASLANASGSSHGCNESDPNSILMRSSSSVMCDMTLSEVSFNPANAIEQTYSPFAPPTSPASGLTAVPLCKKKFHRTNPTSTSPPKSSIVELYCIASLTSARSCEDHCVCGECTSSEIPTESSLNRIRSHYMIDTSKYNIPEETESQVCVSSSNAARPSKTTHPPIHPLITEEPAKNSALQVTKNEALTSDCSSILRPSCTTEPVTNHQAIQSESFLIAPVSDDAFTISSDSTSEKESVPHKTDSASTQVHYPQPSKLTTRIVQPKSPLKYESDDTSKTIPEATEISVLETSIRTQIQMLESESVLENTQVDQHAECILRAPEPIPNQNEFDLTEELVQKTDLSGALLGESNEKFVFSNPQSTNQEVPTHTDAEFISPGSSESQFASNSDFLSEIPASKTSLS